MQKFTPQKYHIKTLGCQANVADSSTMAGILEALGFEKAVNSMESDVFIINTCSVRQKSEDKAYGVGKIIKEHIESGGTKPFTVMSGCLVGSATGNRKRFEFEELKERTPWVDAYINPSQLADLPAILKENDVLGDWAQKKLSSLDTDKTEALLQSPKHAFVNISYGCDNFCTFCVVPYARGNEVSRSKEQVLGEINHLVRRGVSEVTLCGQNVNSWGLSMSEKFDVRTGSDQKLPFAQLLREVHSIPEITKIDFISSNPFDFTGDLIDALTLPKISDFLHIAVQSGNNDVLKRMNRRHTIEDFFELIERVKQAKPNVELGTDVIVGFPGETREQFMDTVELFKKIKFNVAFISIYSPRKGTPAANHFEDDVPLSEKKWRHAHLTDVWVKKKEEG